MNSSTHTLHAMFRHLLIVLALLALAACGSTEPSIDKVRMDLQDVVAMKSFNMLAVTAIEIDKTEKPAEDRVAYRVKATIEVPVNHTATADSLVARPVTSPSGQTIPRNTPLDLFFQSQGWDQATINEFLGGNRKTNLPFALFYRMEGEDYWVLKAIPELQQSAQTGLFR